ncbi:MAG TPA: class I SAM-dependent methyltransferase [Candidatus Limnocylindrales bacterium]|nr:class I SAM-dependent methyltransferase [Candidatus Limnocylindrales bacterium]
MVFRASFDCLWCGTPHAVRAADDLEGYAQLCPDCIGKAGDNGFLRFRLKSALAERSAALAGTSAVAQPAPGPAPDDLGPEMQAYYAARAPEYDDWYLRRGRYSRGPVHDLAWNADLDAATVWLDALPLHGEIVELAAGTGWWSTLLAGKGVLSIYDAVEPPLDRARERLLAHGLRAHIHVRDAWTEPDRPVDALFCGFWLSHVPRARLAEFLGLARRWLKPGGTFAFIDSRPDPHSGAVDQAVSAEAEISERRLADGREFRVVKVFWQPAELEAALLAAGFATARVTTTARFFLLGSAGV